VTCSATVAGKSQDLLYVLRAPVQCVIAVPLRLTERRLLAGDSALVHELTADEQAAPAPAYTA